VARELVPEVRARDGREGDVARGYKSDYFVGADQDIQTAIILLERADNWNTNQTYVTHYSNVITTRLIEASGI
jgi:hypothetical protein